MNCSLCGSTKVFKVYQVRDFFFSGEEFGLMECEECRVRFTHPVPSKEELFKYYKSDEYLSHANKQKTFLAFLYDFIRGINVKWKANQISRYCPNTGAILDVGCGAGVFLSEMKKRGWMCTGVEPDTNSLSYVEDKLQINVVGDILEIEKNKQFDVISLWHVLEHFYDPKMVLNELNTLLKNDGLLVIAVPNYESLDSRYFGSYWAAYDVPRHLYHFSPDVLRSLLESCGFTTLEIKPLAVDVLYITYLSNRYLKKWPALLKGVLRGLYFLLRSRRVSDYSSIVFFARKNC